MARNLTQAAGRGRLRSRLVPLLRLAVSLAIVGGLLVKLSPGDLAQTFRRADVPYLAAAGALLLVVEALVVVKWRLLVASRGLRLPAVALARHFFVGNLLNNVLPTSIGGDVYRVVGVQRETGGGLASVALTVLYERATGYAAMASLGATGAAYHFGSQGAGTLAALAFVLAFLGALLLVDRLPSPPVFLRERLRRLVRDRADAALLLRLTGFSAVIQALHVSVIAMTGRAFGVDVGWWYWALATAAVALATLLPVSLGGLGVRESGYAAVLAPAGVAAAAGASVGFSLALLLTLVSLAGLAVVEAAGRLPQRRLPQAAVVEVLRDP